MLPPRLGEINRYANVATAPIANTLLGNCVVFNSNGSRDHCVKESNPLSELAIIVSNITILELEK